MEFNRINPLQLGRLSAEETPKHRTGDGNALGGRGLLFNWGKEIANCSHIYYTSRIGEMRRADGKISRFKKSTFAFD